MEHYGQVDASSTIRIFFTTHAADGSAVAPNSAFEAGDCILYKDGSATQRTSTSGWTMTSPFDSITGLHLLAIDLSDNTDAGFYAAGSRYTLVLSPDETVDSKAVVRVLADFTIGPVSANVTQLAGVTQSLTDLKDFADDGYDPSTNKVQGLVLADAVTTVNGLAANTITAAATAADFSTEVNAAVLAVLGALADAAADGAVTTTDNLVAYVKQIINTLEGTPGIPAWPSSAAPGNAVSIAEAIRQIYDEVAGLNGGALIAAADVWSVATRTLTALDEDSTTLDLDATIRAALGMSSANLDTQLTAIDDYLDTEIAAIKAKTDNLPSDPADASDIASLIDALPTAAENAAAIWDLSNGIETSITPRQALRLILAASAGKLSGAATTTITIRNVGDSKDRIVATVDSDGNRSAITTDAT